MKILGGIFAALAVLVIFQQAPSVAAVGCSNVSTFGAVTLDLPRLPATEARAIWVRMEAPAPDAKVLVQVNEDYCLQVGGHNQEAGQWSWQSARDNGSVQLINFPKADKNTLKVIGVSDGVKVDRAVITEADCVPQDFGANCQRVQAISQQVEVTELPPPSTEPLNGQILLSATPQKYQDQLENLEYVVDGRTVQESDKVVAFDSTRLPNGKHTVNIVMTLKNGDVLRESTVIEVNNPENAFTPLVRWMKINSSVLLRILAVIGLLTLLAVVARLTRRRRRTKRERSFHGF